MVLFRSLTHIKVICDFAALLRAGFEDFDRRRGADSHMNSIYLSNRIVTRFTGVTIKSMSSHRRWR